LTSTNITYQKIVKLIYYLGISISLIIFVLRFRKLLLLIYPTLKQRDKKIQLGQFTNVKIIHSSQTFSFFNYLFWDSSQKLTTAEEKQILEHELAHINGGHSYDLIFMELQKILFWFNPLIYLYEKELRNQHEFIADRKAKKISNTEDYVSLMVSSLFKSLQLDFIHSFHNQQIKQRIKMLHTKKTSWIKGNAKTILSVAWVLMVAFTFACTKGLEKLSQEDSFLKAEKKLMQEYLAESEEFEKKYPNMEMKFIFKEVYKKYSEDTLVVPTKEVENIEIVGISNEEERKRLTYILLELHKYWKRENDKRYAAMIENEKKENERQINSAKLDKTVKDLALKIHCFEEVNTEEIIGYDDYDKQAIKHKFFSFSGQIDEQGNLIKIEIYQGSGNQACDNEFIKIAKATKWEAWTRNGKPIKDFLFAYTIPFKQSHN
jgi:hypothetical protein